MQRSKKKYNFNTYLHFDAVTVSHPENQESASHVYFGIVTSTSSVNHPPVLERGNKKAIFPINNNRNSILHPYRCRLCIHIPTCDIG